MFIHCAQCQTEFRPGLDRCPECDSDDIMVGRYTPSGMKVSAQRDATRMRLQARHFKGRTRYEFSTGAPPLSGAAREANVAPYLKMYNDVVWNHDRHRMERRVIHVDSDNDYYKQEWLSLETGERTYFKEGKLSDPDMHGKSARRRKMP